MYIQKIDFTLKTIQSTSCAPEEVIGEKLTVTVNRDGILIPVDINNELYALLKNHALSKAEEIFNKAALESVTFA